MKLPKFIIVKGEVWAIKRACLEQIPSFDDRGNVIGHAVGLCEFSTRTIIIHNKLNKELIRPTFLHELGHAIFAEIGFNQTSFSSDFEELIVENFANVYDRTIKTLTFVKPLLVEEKSKKKKAKK